MIVKKAVIPAAGLGTRLLSATKEQPKEMLPVFSSGNGGAICLKPLLQQVFEQLFDFGIREFYFIVGRGKRSIEDHFTPDYEFVQRLNTRRKSSQALQLESFYKKLETSTIVWVNQPEPKGFGDAVLQTESLVGGETFLVHAGDTYVISKIGNVPGRLVETHSSRQCDATLTVKEVQDPRQYGVAEVAEAEETLLVERVEEKPDLPKTRLAIMPIYIFNPSIFTALRTISAGKGGEIQLTDAIQRLVDTGHRVHAIKLSAEDIRLDIGTPETYWEALELSYRQATSKTGPTRP